MKKRRLVLTPAVVTVAAFRLLSEPPSYGTSRVPVTITYQISYCDEKGQPTSVRTFIRAYRSDGSRSQYMVSEKPHFEIFDNQKGVLVNLDPSIRAMLYSKLPGPSPRPVPLTCEALYRWGKCLGPTDEKILGYKLVKAIVDDGLFKEEYFAAPALSFLPLKKLRWRADGSLSQEWIAVRVEPGEPDPKLFEIPEDYEILPDSVYYGRAMTARGRKANERTLELFRRLEKERATGGAPPPR